MYPRIHLTIDNVYGYKRWIDPDEWAANIAAMGVRCIEASADTEHDPVFNGAEYFRTWIDDVRAAEQKHGVRVANLYSGHGTYSTCGMTHPDPRVRDNMLENWFKPMVRAAGELGCGLGFFAHAFPHRILQSPETYAEYVEILVGELVKLNRYAGEVGCRELGLEMMYTPHQYPWTIEQTRELLARVTAESGRDFYFTEDLGHHHIKFCRPSESDYEKSEYPNLWVGSDAAFQLAKAGASWAEVEADMDANPQLFSTPRDGDCYAWLEELGCYSPIIHLQQTDGLISAHYPFTPERNAWGKVEGKRVLEAIRRSYDAPEDPEMPKRCEDIYLTLELFSGTTSIMEQVVCDYETSVAYWRQFIPEDGLALDELLARL